ncbi:VOC family protein [Allonocardiopsis opalescens]|uniref:Putative enzyme related to lactoylglutathione lyase n=1 Tax=Allonocardiopsis opalescens TaxID=1144618 RepID=A0A2T0Q835_9ACTN|nr:VOC family protein [Allonocardiopsis opalescens]PRY00021.1 putative enzyme related to lactoylglutathione lyase [Allonocardiopsis opalescens]
MDWTLEVVVVPVADVDRAKRFYAEQVGFAVDHDTDAGGGTRIVQLTPPGSGCSIVIGTGLPGSDAAPLKGLQLVVSDIEAARAQLLARDVAVSAVHEIDPRDGGRFVYFDDPDGNSWAVQEIRARARA